MKTTVSIQSMDELDALKNAGASGIMVGLKGFQSGCDGVFSMDEIKTLKEKCEEKNLDVMVMMNRLYFDEELNDVHEAVQKVLSLGCRILYCDPAVYLSAVREKRVDQLVYDSSTLMCNSLDVQLMQDLGLNGVVLSREITLEEICTIARKTKGKTIVQAYGYQVMAHSKRHFLRNYMKEIKKDLELENLRDLSLIETTRTGRMPILEEKDGCRIYTDIILCAVKELDAMKESGVKELLLDGLFIDRGEYVSCVKAFNDALCGEDAEALYAEMRNRNEAYGEGYMYTKTNLLKMEGEGR